MGQGTRPVAEQWQQQLGRFVTTCNDSGGAEQAYRLREARALFLHAEPVDEAALEAMIAVDAFESAALAMVGAANGYMLSRGGNGVALASVHLPGSRAQHACEGKTPALALLAAIATALWHAIDDEPGGSRVHGARLN